jgi:hypothetical protein
MLQNIWDQVYRTLQCPGRYAPDFPSGAPPITRMNAGLMSPRFFLKPVVFTIPKNTVVVFYNEKFSESRFGMRSNTQWFRGGMAIASNDVDMTIVVRPTEKAVAEAAKNGAKGESEELLIWMEFGLDCDLGSYFPDNLKGKR